MTDKTKSQTYNFLLENKSIEDIKNQPNIEVKEKRRHGGKTYKLFEKNNDNIWETSNDLLENNRENLEPVTSNLTNEVKEQETNNDIWTKLKNFLITSISNTEEISKLQSIIEEQANEIQKLKKQIEELNSSKQGNINFEDFKYNAITIYDEKQRKNTGIEKIYEEILPIEDKIFFITTLINIDNSIREQVMFFQKLTNGNIKIFKQNKLYDNINDYKKDIKLINAITVNSNYQYVPIKDFLKQHEELKSTPTWSEIGIWIISWLIIPLGVAAINLIHPPLLIMSLVIGGIAIVLRGGAELFSPTSKKVWSWLANKCSKNNEKKDKEKKNINQ